MAATRATTAAVAATRTPLNSNQIKGFWAAWGGWCLDGMDAFIYCAGARAGADGAAAEVRASRRRPATSGYYGSILFALVPRSAGACRWCGDRSRIGSDASRR